MKKLLLFCFITSSYIMNAQCDSTLPVNEDFSNTFAVNSCWSYVDSDGDGLGWSITSMDNSGNKGLKSKSFAGTALTPDNWIISNPINLPSSGSIQLSWKVRATYWQYDAENYSVYVATRNNLSDFISSSVMFTENLRDSDASGVFANRSLNLSALAGQTVYVAFRHYDVTDQFEIDIDDFAISADGSNGGCVLDSDNDGVCDADDVCPGFDDNVDTNNNGIPDGCESSCNQQTKSFPNSTLTFSGTGSGETDIFLPDNSQDINFTISSIDEKTKGKSNTQYIDKVDVSYNDGSKTYFKGTYSGSNLSAATINIPGTVQSIHVKLYNGMNSGANLSVTLSKVAYCSDVATTCPDSDNDGVCDADDVCPGGDDTIDLNGNGIPDCAEQSTCTEKSKNFAKSTLTGASSTTLMLDSNSKDASFTISNINEKSNGKPGSQYIEEVRVTYTNATGTHTYNIFNGSQVSSASINIPGTVYSITVTLSDQLGTNSSNLSVSLSSVSYCASSSTAKTTSEKLSSETEMEPIQQSSLEVYPNPASNNIYIKGENMEDTNASAYVYNMNGALIRQKSLDLSYSQENSLDIAQLPSGLYVLHIVSASGKVIKTDKVIIK